MSKIGDTGNRVTGELLISPLSKLICLFLNTREWTLLPIAHPILRPATSKRNGYSALCFKHLNHYLCGARFDLRLVFSHRQRSFAIRCDTLATLELSLFNSRSHRSRSILDRDIALGATAVDYEYTETCDRKHYKSGLFLTWLVEADDANGHIILSSSKSGWWERATLVKPDA